MGRFAWGVGYGAFSVSHSDVGRVARYIANQEEHRRKRTYAEEYAMFVKRYGLECALKETIEMVSWAVYRDVNPNLKIGENETRGNLCG